MRQAAPSLLPGTPGTAAAAGGASVLAHLLLLAAALHAATPAAPAASASADHRSWWPAVAVTLVTPASAFPAARAGFTPVPPVPVALRRPPALPRLALPDMARQPAPLIARLPAPEPQDADLAGIGRGLPPSPALSGGTAAPPMGALAVPSAREAQASQRMARLQAVRAAQDRLVLDLRVLDPVARECQEVERHTLSCDDEAAVLARDVQERLLFQAAQSRELGLTGDRLAVDLGKGRRLTVTLLPR